MPTPLPRERRCLAIAIRELRARQRLTQEQVAEAAGLGHNYISDLESGRTRPAFESVVLIARGLGVPLTEVVRVFEERLAD
ncbi:MAG: helix-turn-helix transcriptional regulator [Conexibacter sp.]